MVLIALTASSFYCGDVVILIALSALSFHDGMVLTEIIAVSCGDMLPFFCDGMLFISRTELSFFCDSSDSTVLW